MHTRLNPVENPSLTMKVAYLISKWKYGKVISPLKMVYARLPLAFSLFSNRIPSLEKKLKLNKELVYLIRHHVAQINICNFCMDIGVAIAIKEQMNKSKIFALDDFKTNSLFTFQESAALGFAEELTKYKKVSDETFAMAKKQLSDCELAEIAWIVATEHYYNIVNLAFDIESDGLCLLK